MADIYIRNIDIDVKKRLEEAASSHGLSLNKYLCSILRDYANNPSIRSVEDKYANLTKDVISLYEQTLARTNEALAENTYLLKKLMNIAAEGE